MVVYRILNTKNNKVYIGSSNNFIARRAEHLGSLRKKTHSNRFLQFDFNLYGESCFEFAVIIDGFENRTQMILKEYELILKHPFEKSYNIDRICPIQSNSYKRTKKKWKDHRCPKKHRKNKPKKIGKIIYDEKFKDSLTPSAALRRKLEREGKILIHQKL